MRDAWILESKLHPPAPPPHWIERDLSLTSPVTWLVAGPGYGKTLALLTLARQTGSELLWLTADAHDADTATLFHYLIAGMRKHIPDFGAELKAMLQGGAGDPRLLWQRFFQELGAYNMPGLTLVLDDAHALGEALAALAYFFDKLPPGLHVLLASRRRPGGKTRIRGVRWLEQTELAFNPAEIAAFLAARAPHGVPAAASVLEGWPLGLELVTAGGSGSHGAGELDEYVAEELFLGQDEARRDFMLKAALLPEITAEACRWVFQALDAAEKLAELEADHLIVRLAGSPAYRFPAYLRDFLEREAARVVPALTAAHWHRRAAAFYLDQGRDELALPHFQASRDWPAATVAAAACFPGMHFAGRGARIEQYLAGFPADVAAVEPVVQLWLGHLHSRAGRPVEALAAYEAAGRLFQERDDGAGAFKVLVRQLTLAVRQQEMKRFNQLALQALARLEDGLAEDVVDLHLARATAADLRGDQPLMRECNEAALALPLGNNPEIAASHVIAHLNLFTQAFHEGDLGRARQHAQRAGETAADFGFAPYRLYADFLLAHLHVLMDDVEAADALLRSLPASWEELLDWHMRAVAQTVLATWHLARGEQHEAEVQAERSLAVFEQAGYLEGRKLGLEPLMWLAIQRKQFARVAGYTDGEGDERNFYDLSLTLPRARALHLAGEAARARDMLAKLVTACDQADFPLVGARARQYLAAAEASLNRPEEARAALEAAEATAERHGYASSSARTAGFKTSWRPWYLYPHPTLVATGPVFPSAVSEVSKSAWTACCWITGRARRPS
jgi:ATP/maltotriose-dependent transcriptional regulator MalT